MNNKVRDILLKRYSLMKIGVIIVFLILISFLFFSSTKPLLASSLEDRMLYFKQLLINLFIFASFICWLVYLSFNTSNYVKKAVFLGITMSLLLTMYIINTTVTLNAHLYLRKIFDPYHVFYISYLSALLFSLFHYCTPIIFASIIIGLILRHLKTENSQ